MFFDVAVVIAVVVVVVAAVVVAAATIAVAVVVVVVVAAFVVVAAAAAFALFNKPVNKTPHYGHQCRRTNVLSCHRCLINIGVEKMINI